MNTAGEVFFFKPERGAIVRDPDNGFRIVPEEGKLVPNNSYWRRRVKEGSGQRIDEQETVVVEKEEPVLEIKEPKATKKTFGKQI